MQSKNNVGRNKKVLIQWFCTFKFWFVWNAQRLVLVTIIASAKKIFWYNDFFNDYFKSEIKPNFIRNSLFSERCNFFDGWFYEWVVTIEMTLRKLLITRPSNCNDLPPHNLNVCDCKKGSNIEIPFLLWLHSLPYSFIHSGYTPTHDHYSPPPQFPRVKIAAGGKWSVAYDQATSTEEGKKLLTKINIFCPTKINCSQ